MFSALRRRNFALLWIGQLVSLSGDWLLIVALPFYVYQLTGSILQTGVMLMAEMQPRILLGSVAGVFVDRWNRRWTMITSDLLRAGVLLLLLLVHSRDLLWLIYVVTILQAIISQFFTPAASAIIPSLVAEQELVAANSLSSFSEAITRFIGPPLGGILLASLGLVGVTIGDSATFLFSALSILLISLPARAGEKGPGTASPGTAIMNVWREWRDGLRVISQDQVISGVFATMGILMLSQGILNVLLVVFTKEAMHGGALVYSWLITAQGVGSLIGALLVGAISKFVRPVYLIVLPLGFAGCAVLIIFNFPLLALALPLVALTGVFVVGFVVMVQTLLQQGTTENYRGRVFGALNTMVSLLMLVGMLLASTLGDRLGVVPLLNAAGGLFFLAALVALAMLRHASLEEPAVVA
ncbi:MAG: MFS transporter [Ktedonobacteraceae bacterium]|nr:MFS transporter [Ktedonobacteraceae bacterium]